MLPPTSNPAPGWYTDPEQFGMQRYWDGAAWTEQRHPVQAAPMPVAYGAPMQAQMPLAVPAPGNSMATSSLVLGIIGAVFSLIPWTFWLAWILGILAIIFGVIGRKKADREPAAGKRSAATWGLSLGIVAVVLGIVGLILVATVLEDTVNTYNDFESCFDNPDQLHCD